MRRPKRADRRQPEKARKARRWGTQPPAQSKSQSKSQAKSQSESKWSAGVTASSDALDLEPGVFTKRTPAAIARSLKRSAEASDRRKAAPFRSAMSMLSFYINRAGRNLPEARLDVLQRAKDELRKAFGRV